MEDLLKLHIYIGSCQHIVEFWRPLKISVPGGRRQTGSIDPAPAILSNYRWFARALGISSSVSRWSPWGFGNSSAAFLL